MIGKIISDHFGLTEFLGGTVKPKMSFDTEVDDKELDKLQAKIETLDGDEIRIRAAVDESSLRDIDGLADYAVDRGKQGKNISKEGVTELLDKNIADQAHGFLGVNAAIKEYNKLTDKVSRSKFAETISQSNTSLGKYLTGLKDANAGIFSYGRSLVNATAKTVAFNAVMGIMNMAVNIGFSALVSYVITGLGKLIVTTDEAREASRNFIKSVREFNDTSAANSKRIAELNARYKELSNGVSNSGNNVSLTNDQYNEYKDIISEVSDMMPNLTAKYNAQGEKIGFAKGKLDDLTESYKKYQQEVAKNFINGTGDGASVDDAIINFKNQDSYTDGNGDFLSSSHLSQGWEFLKTAYAPHITDNSDIWGNKEKVQNLRAMLNLSKEEMIDYMSEWFSPGAHAMEDLLGFDEDEMEEMTENEIHDAVKTVLEKYEGQIDESYEQLKTGIHEYLKSKDNFWEFDENEQNNVLNFISLLPDNIFPEIGINTEDSVPVIKTKLSEFADDIISQMQKDERFKNAFEEIMTFDPEQSDRKLAGLYGYMEKQAEIVAKGYGISEKVYAFLLAQEIMFNNNNLDVTNKLQGLSKIAQQAGMAAIEVDRLNTVMNGVGLKEGFASENGIGVIKTPGSPSTSRHRHTRQTWHWTAFPYFPAPATDMFPYNTLDKYNTHKNQARYHRSFDCLYLAA